MNASKKNPPIKMCLACNREWPTDLLNCPVDNVSLIAIKGDSVDVDGYKDLELIATGYWARVYAAISESDNRTVVLKIYGDTESQLKLVEQQQRSLFGLAHAGVVQSIELIRTQGGTSRVGLVEVVAFAGSSNLREAIQRNGPFSVTSAVRIGSDVCDVLSYLEQVGFPHPNLKSSHIVLSDTDPASVTLIDFCDRQLVHENRTIAVSEVPVIDADWISPEQLMGSAKATSSSNLYSLGVVMFEMLTGSSPFAGRNNLETAWNHLRNAVPRLNTIKTDLQVPPPLEDAIRWALEKDPRKRPQSAAQFKAAMNAAIH